MRVHGGCGRGETRRGHGESRSIDAGAVLPNFGSAGPRDQSSASTRGAGETWDGVVRPPCDQAEPVASLERNATAASSLRMKGPASPAVAYRYSEARKTPLIAPMTSATAHSPD